MIEEPSVLDYLKSKLNPGKYGKIHIPEPGNSGVEEWTAPEVPGQAQARLSEQPAEGDQQQSRWEVVSLPWKIAEALLSALLAQFLLEPPTRQVGLALFLYAWAILLIVLASLKGEVYLAEAPVLEGRFNPPWRPNRLLIGFPFLIGAFLLFGGNRFTFFNLVMWGILFILVLRALWEKDRPPLRLWQHVKGLFHNAPMHIRLEPQDLLLVGVAVLAVYFRFTQLGQVPAEMFSDHAEKLIDVGDVLQGQTAIFFPRNTGREALQMYLTAAVSQVFGTGLSFMSLKIGTALAGLFTLPYIYLLGKETGNKWVGLAAVTLAAIAYWPNVIARVALRFALYPLFTAPTLYYLIRGLRRARWNDLLLAGLVLGVGLHGYSPMRIVPLVVVAAFGVYLLHPQSSGQRKQALWGLVALALVAFLVFLPLLRYMLDDPQLFWARAFSRSGSTERSIAGAPWLIFLKNAWKAWIMPFWDNGSIWVHSIPGRPALGVVSAALYLLGLVLLAVRYVRKRHWLDVFLILAVPLLMLPSSLSIAFPDENPSLNRTGGAYVVIFLIAGLGAEGVFRALAEKARGWFGKAVTVLLGLSLLVGAVGQNYDLVLNQFATQFRQGAWNTSQIGAVIQGFATSVGDRDSAYVVPFPHWVDTRLVGINAGFPEKDYALGADQLDSTLTNPGAKLFIVKTDDQETLDLLHALYPTGYFTLHTHPLPGKNFWAFFVPPEDVQYPEMQPAE